MNYFFFGGGTAACFFSGVIIGALTQVDGKHSPEHALGAFVAVGLGLFVWAISREDDDDDGRVVGYLVGLFGIGLLGFALGPGCAGNASDMATAAFLVPPCCAAVLISIEPRLELELHQYRLRLKQAVALALIELVIGGSRAIGRAGIRVIKFKEQLRG